MSDLMNRISKKVDDEILGRISNSGIHDQLNSSIASLEDLAEDGLDLITNVELANKQRESDRLLTEAAKRSELTEDLSNESALALSKFDAINEHWSQIAAVKDPFALFESLEAQKEMVADLLHQKDEIIAEIRYNIAQGDSRYYSDQEKQNVDITNLVERIDMQIEVMKDGYREHLELLQDTIDREQGQFRSASCKKWDTMYDEWLLVEANQTHIQRDATKLHYNKMEKIIQDQAELLRSTRIKLEKDNETLQLQLQSVKANVLLNSEKLKYNHQVLQKKAEENVILRCQQKKRISKLNETVLHLRKKITEKQTKYNEETIRLTNDILKLNASLLDLENKSEEFTENGRRQYQKVWDLNEREAKKLLRRVMNADEILFEQQLGFDWHKPDSCDIEKCEYNKSKMSARESARSSIARSQPNSAAQKSKLNLNAIQNMLQQIIETGSFLFEDKQLELSRYSPSDITLLHIDAILKALKIEDMEELEALRQHFVRFSWCPNCTSRPTDIGMATSALATPCNDHNLLIEPAFVFLAFREYAAIKKNPPKTASRRSSAGLVAPVARDEVKNYWTQFENAIPVERERLWHGLGDGLEKYLMVLKERQKRDEECEFLRRQNSELRHLLNSYFRDSKDM